MSTKSGDTFYLKDLSKSGVKSAVSKIGENGGRLKKYSRFDNNSALSKSVENGNRPKTYSRFYKSSPPKQVDQSNKQLQTPKLTVMYQPHHYGLSNGISYESRSSTNSPTEFHQQTNGFSWNIESGGISGSLPTISLHITEVPAPINESFIYQCEFCSDSFSCDQLLIDHCARKHTKDVKCQHCEKTFYWEKDLHFHMRKHIKKGRGFKCQICTGLFIKGSELKEHMKMHDTEDSSVDGSFPCDICDKTFKSNRTLQEHKKRFFHKQCEVCLEYYSSDAALFQHFNVHVTQPATSYSCDQCDEIFPRKNLLKLHREKHRLYVCELCSAEFRRKEDIKSHLRMDCTKRSLFYCSVCNKSFLSESNLKEHINIGHYERNKCEFCSEKFLLKSELVDHLDRHNDIEHPYQCHICLAPMTSKRIFNFHMKSHNDKSKYQCDRCFRYFQSGYHLQNHIQFHSRDTFKCDICTMSFSDAHRFEQHSKSHDVNAFSCDICKRSFRTRHLIFVHMIDLHQSRKKCHICEKEFINQRRLMTHLKSHYVKVVFPDDDTGM